MVRKFTAVLLAFAACVKDWRTLRYHAPSDDTNQPVDLAAAAGYEERGARG